MSEESEQHLVVRAKGLDEELVLPALRSPRVEPILTATFVALVIAATIGVGWSAAQVVPLAEAQWAGEYVGFGLITLLILASSGIRYGLRQVPTMGAAAASRLGTPTHVVCDRHGFQIGDDRILWSEAATLAVTARDSGPRGTGHVVSSSYPRTRPSSFGRWPPISGPAATPLRWGPLASSRRRSSSFGAPHAGSRGDRARGLEVVVQHTAERVAAR